MEISNDFPETMLDNREKLDNLVFFAPWGHNVDFSEKWTEIVSESFLTSFRTLFSVFLYDQLKLR